MDLKSFLAARPADERDKFAELCGTTAGHMRNVSYGYRPCATDLAVAIERESGKAVTRQELREDWAAHWPELVGSAEAA
jgi:DNA-binding transcriptional regulator YdaS (Cro superfamily)